MTSSLLASKPEYTRPTPVLAPLPPLAKITFGHRWKSITQWQDNPDDAIQMAPDFGIQFFNISAITIGEYPTSYGTTNHITIDFQTPTEEGENAFTAADLRWAYGYEGEVGSFNKQSKKHLVQVHTASLITQLDILLQQGVALQEVSGTIHSNPWNKACQAVVRIKDQPIPYQYSADDRKPELFTSRVNRIAMHLGGRKPFLSESVNESEADFTPVPVLNSVNDSTTDYQEDD